MEAAEEGAGLERPDGAGHGLRRDQPRRRDGLDAALSDTGRLDIWVNNAGRAGAFGPGHARRRPFWPPPSSEAPTTGSAALDAMTKAGGGDLINLLGRWATTAR